MGFEHFTHHKTASLVHYLCEGEKEEEEREERPTPDTPHPERVWLDWSLGTGGFSCTVYCVLVYDNSTGGGSVLYNLSCVFNREQYTSRSSQFMSYRLQGLYI